jgi:glycosyltransferase involved in cell wall biosynthesis
MVRLAVAKNYSEDPEYIRILALTQGLKNPAARFRLRQYIENFASHRIFVKECYTRGGGTPPSQSSLSRMAWAAGNIGERLPQVMSAIFYDAVFLQRPLISKYMTYERFLPQPLFFDVDDAIWLGNAKKQCASRERMIERISQRANIVFCGNSFIKSWFEQRSSGRTLLLPTAVDISRFVPRSSSPKLDRIVWSGTSSGFDFLYSIQEPIRAVLEKYPNFRLRVVSDRPPAFNQLSDQQVEFMYWTEDSEVTSINDCRIGLMPLFDSEWCRGKCSYKMLLYMACGLPSVVSDIGMNSEILSLGDIGYGCRNEKQWYDSISALIENESVAVKKGHTAREVVIRYYSKVAVSKILCTAIREEVNGE